RRTPLNFFDPSPEVFLLYGRGDLSPRVLGNWNMAYPWVGSEYPLPPGSLSKQAGPADYVIRFRVQIVSPRSVLVGLAYGSHAGWRVRSIDVSRFGRITGVWEIGPIISLDRWIPDVLAKELHLDQSPAWIEGLMGANTMLGKPADYNKALAEAAQTLTTVDPP